MNPHPVKFSRDSCIRAHLRCHRCGETSKHEQGALDHARDAHGATHIQVQPHVHEGPVLEVHGSAPEPAEDDARPLLTYSHRNAGETKA